MLVIGAGGDRDIGKRPVMGAIGARLADVLVVTDDNPRTEDPADDPRRPARGRPRRSRVPRSSRSATVVRRSGAPSRWPRPGDTVVIAGKGHETGQEIQGTVHPFDDREELRDGPG